MPLKQVDAPGFTPCQIDMSHCQNTYKEDYSRHYLGSLLKSYYAAYKEFWSKLTRNLKRGTPCRQPSCFRRESFFRFHVSLEECSGWIT